MENIIDPNAYPVGKYSFESEFEFGKFGVINQKFFPKPTLVFDNHPKNRAILENQIKFWFDLANNTEFKKITQVNTVFVSLFDPNTFGPLPTLGLFKLSGSTRGQQIVLSLYECHNLLLALIHGLDLLWKALNQPEAKSINIRHVEFDEVYRYRPRTFEFSFFDLRAGGLPVEKVFTGTDKPFVDEDILNKIDKRLNNSYSWMEFVNVESFRVLKCFVQGKFYFGLEKILGESTGQVIFFSAYEAQWLVVEIRRLLETCRKH